MTTVLYHKHCPDGFGAALACWLRFGDSAEYLPVTYHEPPPSHIPLGDELYIVDFSYDAEILRELAVNHEILLIDHHKTAEPLTREDIPRVKVIFDMEESGATLTWNTLHNTPMPVLFQYLRDRDLWRWELPRSKEVSAGLRSYPMTFSTWQQFLDDDICNKLADEGTYILRHIEKQVKALASNAVICRIQGHEVPCVNTPLYGSEVGNYLCEQHPTMPFAICYSMQPTRQWRWEFRSIGAFDVSAIAKSFGGGGHKNAAGCILASPPPADI